MSWGYLSFLDKPQKIEFWWLYINYIDYYPVVRRELFGAMAVSIFRMSYEGSQLEPRIDFPNRMMDYHHSDYHHISSYIIIINIS